MWTLLKILLLGGGVTLTTQTVDIGQAWVLLTPSEPLNVVTEGAALYISVPGLESAGSDVLSRIKAAELRYPNGCVRARLVGVDGKELEMANRSAGASNAETLLILSAEQGIPTDRRFAKVLLSAACELKGVRITWQNYSM